MATFYLRTSTGLASEGRGLKHMSYVSGIGAYSDKTEVKHIVDKHIPSFATDALDFFDQSDKLERQNGRSYRSLVIAIPTEAPYPLAWTQLLVDELLKDQHTYRLVIHDKGDGNPHAHVVFSERGLKEGKTPKDFFSRQNPKDRAISTKPWLKQAKAVYLAHVRTVAPDYVPPNSGEIKIGPKLKGAKASYTERHDLMGKHLEALRKGTKAAQKLDRQITALKAEINQGSQGPKVATPAPTFTDPPAKRRTTLSRIGARPVSSKTPKTLEQLQEHNLRHLEIAAQCGQDASRVTMEADQMLHDANMRLSAALNAPFTPSSQALRRKAQTSPFNISKAPKLR